MSSPVHPLTTERNETKQGNMKIVVRSAVTAKVGEMEEKTIERRIRMMREEVVARLWWGRRSFEFNSKMGRQKR